MPRKQREGNQGERPSQTALSVSPWSPPTPPGLAGALDSTYTVTGPILAGFASTIVALVAPAPTSLAAGWLVLDCGVITVGTLVVALQLSFHAKAVWTTPYEFIEWYPFAKRDAETLETIRIWQHGWASQWHWYQRRARACYHVGLLFFLATVLLVVVPADAPRVIPHFAIAPYVPVLVGLLFLVLEAWWIAAVSWERTPLRQLIVAPMPTGDVPPTRDEFRPDLYE